MTQDDRDIIAGATVCPKCGAGVPPGAKSCIGCGAPFAYVPLLTQVGATQTPAEAAADAVTAAAASAKLAPIPSADRTPSGPPPAPRPNTLPALTPRTLGQEVLRLLLSGLLFLVVPCFWPLLPFVAAGAIAWTIYRFHHPDKRARELAEWAARKGFRFSPSDYPSIDRAYPAFACLHHGSARCGSNLTEGNWNARPFQAFDYRYNVKKRDANGKTRTKTYEFSAVILSPDVPLKPIFISPLVSGKVTEALASTPFSLLGTAAKVLERLADSGAPALRQNVEFESIDFNNHFQVTTNDPKWAFAVLHLRAMEFLLSAPRFKIQFDQGAVIAYGPGKLDCQHFEAAAGVVQGLLDYLPEYVKQQQRVEVTLGP